MDWYWYLVVFAGSFAANKYLGLILTWALFGFGTKEDNNFSFVLVGNFINFALLVTILVFLFVEFKFAQ